MARPILTDLRIEGGGVQGTVPIRLPDLHAGTPARIGLALKPRGGQVRVTGCTPDGEWSAEILAPAVRSDQGNHAVCALYGREYVEDLETRLAADTNARDYINSRIEEAGFAFQISTRLTSWIAVSEEPWNGSGRLVREGMPHELAHGTSIAGYGLRQPAGDILSDGDNFSALEAFDTIDTLGCSLLPIRERPPFVWASLEDVRKDVLEAAISAKPSLAGETGAATSVAPQNRIAAQQPIKVEAGDKIHQKRIPPLRRLSDERVSDLDAYLPEIVAGDPAAFGRWIACAEPSIRLGLRRFAAAVDVEAVVQEALLRLWQVAPRFQPDGRPNGLLRLAAQIAKNLAISEMRRSRPAAVDQADLEEREDDSPVPLPDPMLRRVIEECRDKLPPKPRAALDARLHSAGADPDERLAELIGMRKNTFLQNFTRARKFLADCLREHGVELPMEAP